MAYFENVFSQYSVTDVAFKASGASAYTNVNGAGTAQESYEQKVVTKANSNIVVKQVARRPGSGALTLSVHMPYELYNTLHGLVTSDDESMISGVYGYGYGKAPECEIALAVEDEDGNVMYKYYPCARCSSFQENITSEEDQVAEVEMEFALSADAYGEFRYSALASALPSSGTITADTWLTAVSSENLHTSANG